MFQTDPFSLIVLFVGMSLLPFLAMVATSYLKIVVVISLVRNALGIQSIPPNMVVNALALILSFFVMAPVAEKGWDIFREEAAKNKENEMRDTVRHIKSTFSGDEKMIQRSWQRLNQR